MLHPNSRALFLERIPWASPRRQRGFRFGVDDESSVLALKNGFSKFASNPALPYGCLAGSSLFAVYGLTGGFKNVAAPHLKVGFDHYPVLFRPNSSSIVQ